jgi:hypothetical protein
MLKVSPLSLLFLLGLTLASGECPAQSGSLKLAELPRHGELRRGEHAWSGSFFPDLIGGLERASQKSEPLDQKWLRLTGDAKTAAWLKLDLKLRRKGFFFTPYWVGFCNGWSLAATRHPLPRDKTVKTASGEALQFSSYELQALATWYYAAIPTKKAMETLGDDCSQETLDFGECRPLEAHVFHTRLAEGLAKGEAWIADIHIDPRIDNHPILAYDARELSPGEYETVVTYLDHYYFKKGRWKDGKPSRRTFQRTYRYRIVTDAEGRAISSEWLTRQRPNFIWRMKETGFEKGFEILGQLLD